MKNECMWGGEGVGALEFLLKELPIGKATGRRKGPLGSVFWCCIDVISWLFLLRLHVVLVWSVVAGLCLMNTVAASLPTPDPFGSATGAKWTPRWWRPGGCRPEELALSSWVWSETDWSAAQDLCHSTTQMFEWMKDWEWGSKFRISIDLKSLVII